MMKAEPLFVGFVLGRCEMILDVFRDDLPQEVYDSLVIMRDTAREIAKGCYETKIETEDPPKLENKPAEPRKRKQKGL